MYYHGIESFWMSIIVVAVVPISTFLFVSMFHNMEMTSIFQVLLQNKLIILNSQFKLKRKFYKNNS